MVIVFPFLIFNRAIFTQSSIVPENSTSVGLFFAALIGNVKKYRLCQRYYAVTILIFEILALIITLII